MQEWLPWTMLIVVAMLVGTAPWRRVDPRHEFIIGMLANLDFPDPMPTTPTH